MSISILRLPAVKQITGLGRSEIYRRMAIGEFPRSVSLGARAVGWPSDRIEAWVAERIGLATAKSSASLGASTQNNERAA